MPELSKEQCLLEEWKIGEGTIWVFDRICTNIRFYGTTATVALMGAATEALRSPGAVVNFFGMRTVHISAFIAALSTIFVVIVWLMNRHYFSYLLMVVERLRQIEEELAIDGEQVLKLSHGISRSKLPRIVRALELSVRAPGDPGYVIDNRLLTVDSYHAETSVIHLIELEIYY